MSMQVGDTLDAAQVNTLPVGAIVRHERPSGSYATVVVRVGAGFHWSDSESSHPAFEDKIYARGPWTLVFLPPVKPLKVGDIIDTEEQAARLPIGSVVVDTADHDAARRPAIKIRSDLWLFEEEGPRYLSTSEIDFEGSDVLVYLPDADTGSGRTAA
jgi:hypothetical protein